MQPQTLGAPLTARRLRGALTNSAWPEADWEPGYEAVDAFNRAVVSGLRPDDSRARGPH